MVLNLGNKFPYGANIFRLSIGGITFHVWHIALCKQLALVYIHEFVPLRKPGKSPLLFSLYISPFLVFS